MKRKTTLVVIACATVVAAVSHATTVDAHSGPPFPIVSNQIAGPYDVSVWTDPDATADGSAAGQDVFHGHLHVVPRFGGDGFGFRLPSDHASRPRSELDQAATMLRASWTSVE